jgi:hypothetical protein
MRKKHVFYLISIILSLGLMTQCEKHGEGGGGLPDDSDAPPWAGGNTDENPHNKKGDSGGKPGVEYGDQIMLNRDENGVAELFFLSYIDDEGVLVEEWIVRPVAEDGTLLEIYLEGETAGELIDPEATVEIDFGRLNIVKSPESVLNQAFTEALKVLKAEGAVITLDFCGRLTTTWPVDPNDLTLGYNVKTIDSPRENMAIYKYLMQNLFEGDDNELAFLGTEYGFNPLDIAASCFAAGSDKTGFVDIDEVVYINGMTDCYGINPIENCFPYNDQEGEEELNRDGTVRQYFDFGQSGVTGGATYMYNRECYQNRYLQFLVWENIYYPVDPETGLSEGPVFTIKEVAEGIVGNWGSLFRDMWVGGKSHVNAFAWAVDDAVQVLEFVHGDSNIRYVDADGNPL